MTTTPTDLDLAQLVIDSCILHGRRMLASQLPHVEAANYDLNPDLEETTTDLFLAGAMWRVGEQFDLPTDARTRALICLLSMLVSDGVAEEEARQRIGCLMQMADTPGGPFVMAAGYRAEEGDGTLAKCFECFLGCPVAHRARYRFVDRARPQRLDA